MSEFLSFRGESRLFDLFASRSARLVVLLLLILLPFLAIMITEPTHAAQTAPYKINYQGRLTDSTGNVMPNGLYNIRFRIVDAPTSGTVIWTETREAGNRVQITNGLFNVQLGDVTPMLPTTVYPLYLEVELPTPATATCGTGGSASWTEGPMTPRQAFASAPYAMNADTIDGIDGAALAQLSANQTFTGTNTFSNTATFTGSVLHQNTSNSTTAFTIQNASSAHLLVADTTNMALKIGGGDVSPNGSPALFVLDHKNTSGDPAGTNGAMYYNSNAGKFRCYEAGGWKDCITTKPTRNHFEHSNDFIGGIALGNGTVVDSVLIADTDNSGTITLQNGEVDHPGIVRLQSNTSTNAGLSLASNYFSATDTIVLANGTAWSTSAIVRVSALSAGGNTYVVYNGIADNVDNHAPNNGCYLRYSSAASTGWQGVCETAGSEATCNTGVTVAASTWYDLSTSINSAGTVATFIVNGSSCTVSSNIPTSAPVGISLSFSKTAGSTNRWVDVDYMDSFGVGMAR